MDRSRNGNQSYRVTKIKSGQMDGHHGKTSENVESIRFVVCSFAVVIGVGVIGCSTGQ